MKHVQTFVPQRDVTVTAFGFTTTYKTQYEMVKYPVYPPVDVTGGVEYMVTIEDGLASVSEADNGIL